MEMQSINTNDPNERNQLVTEEDNGRGRKSGSNEGSKDNKDDEEKEKAQGCGKDVPFHKLLNCLSVLTCSTTLLFDIFGEGAHLRNQSAYFVVILCIFTICLVALYGFVNICLFIPARDKMCSECCSKYFKKLAYWFDVTLNFIACAFTLCSVGVTVAQQKLTEFPKS